jgi:phage head maturation protease
MPFVIEHTEKGYCVYTQGADGEATGDPHGCHETYKEARQQQKALYANVPDASKTKEKPTGSQGEGEKYADPGYQDDNQPRYPVTKGGNLNEDRVRAAWSYIHHADNRKLYTSSQLSHIEGVIRSAAKEVGVELSSSTKTAGDYEIWIGGEVKALGNGKVGGYLISFGDESTPDQTEFRDFFTPETDYHVDSWPHPMGIYFWHGAHEMFGPTRLGNGKAERDNVGIHLEGQMNLRTPAEQRLYSCAEAGELGWSSGSMPLMVRREPVGKAHKVLSWQLGEASLGPIEMVADPRNVAVALKSIELPRTWAVPIQVSSLAESTEQWIDSGSGLLARYRQLHEAEVKVGRVLSASRMERLNNAHQLIGDILKEATPVEEVAPPPAESETEEAKDIPGQSLDTALMKARARAILILGEQA